MKKLTQFELEYHIQIAKGILTIKGQDLEKILPKIVLFILIIISIVSFIFYYTNGLGVAYNDARSHLDIGRRVVEGLKPGLGQIGSVWLPLPHLLMIPTIWNNGMWHSGLSGALESMISFVAIGFLIFLFLKRIETGIVGRIVGVFIFVANINVLYLQSTAMTELPLLAAMIAGIYYLLVWQQEQKIIDFVKASFWIMLTTLIRYDGWFLFFVTTILIAIVFFKQKGYKATEGLVLLFITLAGFGIALWFLWNQFIFHDALYFALGPYSAHAQQEQLSQAGDLITKSNLALSFKVYYYALAYNVGLFILFLGAVGAVIFYLNKKICSNTKIISLALLTPLVFNILSLYLGFSVLFVQGISGNTLFNVRYGIMMSPSIAIFVGYLVGKVKTLRTVLIGLLLFVTFFSFASKDAVTIDDARVGASQKNVTEVSTWLAKHAKDEPGLILISAASHDAIIFSSGLPMSKFIHEGTGTYWDSATKNPDRWAQWIVMRTNDINDQTFKVVRTSPGFKKYTLIEHFPFADIYELNPRYLDQLHVISYYGKKK